MANDTLKTVDPDTFNVDWLRRDTGDVFTALDTLGEDTISADVNKSLNAIKNLQPNFGLGDSYLSLNAGDNLGGDDDLVMPEVSQETMDQITPAIGIGVGELLTRGRGLGFPEGLKPKIRAGGAKGVAFTLATRANEMGKDFARDYLGMKEEGAAVTGGVAAYGAWKGAPWLAKTILADVKVGMATEVIESLVTEAGKGAWKVMLKEGDNIRMAAEKIGTPVSKSLRVNTINAASIAGKEAMKEMSEQTAQVMKERMGRVAAEGWDDVTKRLLNPSVSARVGRYLAAVAPKLSAKLALSGTAIAIPEGVSTILGGLGLAWTAYDILNLAKQMPELHALIFEDTPEESIEDAFIDEATTSDTLFAPGEQEALL